MMKKEWKIKKGTKSPESLFGSEILKEYSATILDILAKRGVDDDEKVERFFDFDYEKDVLDPFDFPDMEKAALRILEAQEKNEKIAIFGDYDADGVTATALLVETLENLGFEKPFYYIPDRQSEGYGINKNAIDYLLEKDVKLVVTVDCGISNREEIGYAKEKGLDVIVTDHHQIPEKLPEALAIINPHMKEGYSFFELAGVGVSFKLAQALYQKKAPEKIDQLKWSLDLVAIGTIADCVPICGENRILTKFGLIVLEKTKRVGLKELFQVGKVNINENERATTQKVAFQIAPRINAAGRMNHASVALELLLEDDLVSARSLALEIEDQNKARQKVTAEIVREVGILAENSFKDKKFIVASNPHWSVGILGIVAGRISDKFKKPTLVMQEKCDEEWVGSLRSVPNFDIMNVLRDCQECLLKFGGHAQAAGISVAKNQMPSFYKKTSAIIEEKLANYEVVNYLEIDSVLTAQEIDWNLMQDLKKMEPFGERNIEPIFLLENMQVEEVKIVGNGKKHLKLWIREEKSPKIFEGIGFGLGENWSHLEKNDKIDLVFSLEEDKWNGSKKIQLRLIDIRK